jgi:hypothetical protein
MLKALYAILKYFISVFARKGSSFVQKLIAVSVSFYHYVFIMLIIIPLIKPDNF